MKSMQRGVNTSGHGGDHPETGILLSAENETKHLRKIRTWLKRNICIYANKGEGHS